MHEILPHRPIARATALATLGGGVLLGSQPLRAQSSPTSIHMGTMPVEPSGEPFYGLDAGIWQANGLSPEITYFTTGANIVTALVAGDIDVGIVNPMSVAVAISRDIPLQVIAPGVLISKRDAYPNLVVAKASPVKTAKDLTGATIGVAEIGSFNYYSVLAWLDINGANSKSVKFVELPMSEVGVALDRDRIQASFLQEPYTSRFLATGQVRLFGDTYTAIGPELSVAIWAGTRAWVRNNPDTAKKLMNGIWATGRYCNTHLTETGASLMKVAKLDAATLASLRRLYFATGPDKKYLDPILQMANKYGALKRPVSYDEFMGLNNS